MKLDKILTIIGNDTAEELGAMDKDSLKSRVVAAEEAMRDVQIELDNNTAYQEMLLNKKAMEAGKNEVNKRQKAIIAYILHLLNP